MPKRRTSQTRITLQKQYVVYGDFMSVTEFDGVRVLDDEGEVVEGAEVPDLSDDELVGMYRHMLLARRFDERAVSLQRQGRMGTYPPVEGQEAAQVGSAYALGEDDWVVPSYRETAAFFVRGVEPRDVLLYWMGDERGNVPARRVFPIAVPIATHIPHATGLAWASKMKGEDAVVACYFGDGATSEGDFHEGLNFAGVYDVPAVFFCNNNGWAISVSRDQQTASETLAEKAEAYGFEGVRVDGTDPLASYAVMKDAVEKARGGGGGLRPTLVEAVQYRLGAHTTADDPTKYRDDEEVENWRERDPLPKYEKFLRNRGLLDDDAVEKMEAEVEEKVAEATEEAEALEPQETDAMFEHVFEETPEALREQAAEARRFDG